MVVVTYALRLLIMVRGLMSRRCGDGTVVAVVVVVCVAVVMSVVAVAAVVAECVSF